MSFQPGKHTVTISEVSVGESSKKGTPGVFFTFRDSEGNTIEGTLWLTESCYERTLKTLRELGFNDDFATISDQLTDRQCSITVELEADDNGKEWPRVKWINPLRAAGKPAGSDLLSRLSAQAKRIPRPADLPPPQAKKPAPAKSTAPVDEDVPF